VVINESLIIDLLTLLLIVPTTKFSSAKNPFLNIQLVIFDNLLSLISSNTRDQVCNNQKGLLHTDLSCVLNVLLLHTVFQIW
jgi:hypothetical protein